MRNLRINSVSVGIFFVLTIGFIILSYLVHIYPPSSLDLNISHEVQKDHTLALDHFTAFISWFGHVSVAGAMTALVALLFFLFNYKREALFTILTLASGLISTVIKIMVNRPRPTKELVRIVEIAKQQSFPSGHTLFYTIFFGFLIIVMANLKSVNHYIRVGVTVVSAAMILLIPVCRIYLGAHWFTDVLGGLILGVLCLFVLGYFYLSDKWRTI